MHKQEFNFHGDHLEVDFGCYPFVAYSTHVPLQGQEALALLDLHLLVSLPNRVYLVRIFKEFFIPIVPTELQFGSESRRKIHLLPLLLIQSPNKKANMTFLW